MRLLGSPAISSDSHWQCTMLLHPSFKLAQLPLTGQLWGIDKAIWLSLEKQPEVSLVFQALLEELDHHSSVLWTPMYIRDPSLFHLCVFVVLSCEEVSHPPCYDAEDFSLHAQQQDHPDLVKSLGTPFPWGYRPLQQISTAVPHFLFSRWLSDSTFIKLTSFWSG